MPTVESKAEFLQALEEAFGSSNLDFARTYYLFATAKLLETYNSQEIYDRYPLLTQQESFQRLKTLYDANPQDEETKRMFTAVLGSYIGNQLCALSDELQNLKNQLKVPVSDLGLKNPQGEDVQELLYEDVSEWLKKLASKATREALYQRMAQAYTEHLSPRFIEILVKEADLMAELGYPDFVAFTSQTTGHDLHRLGEKAQQVIRETEDAYQERIAAFYRQRTGEDLSQATRADISYVFHGKSPETEAIDRRFQRDRLVPLATATFDGLGLAFSKIAQTVDFPTREAYEAEVVAKTDAARRNGQTLRRILLDIANREGKRSRAYVYPAQVPSEIYLSVKPEGGLDDYSAFFHESGHALHFAYEDPGLSFAMAQMGNNTVTESYAYLFQNLFLNRHWLEHQAGLTPEEAAHVVRRGALNDLYMLRRYASKLQFELKLFEYRPGQSGLVLEGKDRVYADLLTAGTGFRYDAEGWTRDVDAGFYVADYFTAWALEAQLRDTLARRFGTPAALHGEDWYRNPAAGAFLQELWQGGNLTQQALSDHLGFGDPTDVAPLLTWMHRNLQAG